MAAGQPRVLGLEALTRPDGIERTVDEKSTTGMLIRGDNREVTEPGPSDRDDTGEGTQSIEPQVVSASPSAVVRGRCFSADDLAVIRQVVNDLSDQGRTAISVEVCKRLEWRQPNGWLKDRACRDVLRKLEQLGHIALPPPLNPNQSPPYKKWAPRTIDLPEQPLVTALRDKMQFVLAKGGQQERDWNRLVQAYHYLGHRVSVGKCLKFLVKSGGTTLAAVSLAESSWAVHDRDLALRRIRCPLEKTANNNRFLIPPYVQIPNLASRVLSLLAVEGVEAWKQYYAIELICLETYVDAVRFRGTSYRAANWVEVGATSGYRKIGNKHANSQTPKNIYLYPIYHSQRAELDAYIREQRAGRQGG